MSKNQIVDRIPTSRNVQSFLDEVEERYNKKARS